MILNRFVEFYELFCSKLKLKNIQRIGGEVSSIEVKKKLFVSLKQNHQASLKFEETKKGFYAGVIY